MDDKFEFAEWISLKGYVFTASGQWINRIHPYNVVAESTIDLYVMFLRG
jgi:hypothetical protein